MGLHIRIIIYNFVSVEAKTSHILIAKNILNHPNLKEIKLDFSKY